MLFASVYLKLGWITFCRRKRCRGRLQCSRALPQARLLLHTHARTLAHARTHKTVSCPRVLNITTNHSLHSFWLLIIFPKDMKGLATCPDPPLFLPPPFLMGRLWKSKMQGCVSYPSFSALFVFCSRLTKGSNEMSLCCSLAVQPITAQRHLETRADLNDDIYTLKSRLPHPALLHSQLMQIASNSTHTGHKRKCTVLIRTLLLW